MAPEQMDPTIERLDWRTDVFALGAILYEICRRAGIRGSAQLATSRRSAKTRAHLQDCRRSPSTEGMRLEIPREVEDICMQAIAVDRSQRLETVRELANAIEEWIEGIQRSASA